MAPRLAHISLEHPSIVCRNNSAGLLLRLSRRINVAKKNDSELSGTHSFCSEFRLAAYSSRGRSMARRSALLRRTGSPSAQELVSFHDSRAVRSGSEAVGRAYSHVVSQPDHRRDHAHCRHDWRRPYLRGTESSSYEFSVLSAEVLLVPRRRARLDGRQAVRRGSGWSGREVGQGFSQEAYLAASKIAPHDNEFTVRDRAPLYMAMPEVLDGLGLVDDMEAVPLTVEKNSVQTTVILKPEAGLGSGDGFALPAGWVDAREGNAPVPLWLKDPGNYYWFQYLPESRTIYVQFNAVANKSDETLEAFFKRVMAFADTHPLNHFVLDERLNGGGNNYLLRSIIHGFIRSDTVNQPGKLFTIIGRKTFSAAMNFANRMKLDTNTLFVGEPTGSSPNMYGDNAPVVLPNSKLSMRLSFVWWQDMDPRDVRIWQAPDLSTELTFADYQAGRDPAMEAILSYEPGADIVALVEAAVEKNDYAGAKQALLTFMR